MCITHTLHFNVKKWECQLAIPRIKPQIFLMKLEKVAPLLKNQRVIIRESYFKS